MSRLRTLRYRISVALTLTSVLLLWSCDDEERKEPTAPQVIESVRYGPGGPELTTVLVSGPVASPFDGGIEPTEGPAEAGPEAESAEIPGQGGLESSTQTSVSRPAREPEGEGPRSIGRSAGGSPEVEGVGGQGPELRGGGQAPETLDVPGRSEGLTRLDGGPMGLEAGADETFLVWENESTGERFVWRMRGTERLSGASLGKVSLDWDIVDVAGLSSDESGDIIWENRSTGQRHVWLMTGVKRTGDVSLGVVPVEWRIAAVEDLTGDGHEDVVWRNRSTGALYVWAMVGTEFSHGVSIGTVSTDWRLAGAGDLDGDGATDLFWENRTTGKLYYWLMDGLVRRTGGGLGTVPTEWTVAGLEDLNNDGHTDLVWQNTHNGSRYVWYLQGTEVQSGEPLATVDPVWRIAAVSGPVPPPGLTVTTTSLDDGVAGEWYQQILGASGGSEPYTWSVSSGTLPSGLTLSADGTLSGTVTGSGSATVQLTVESADGWWAQATVTITVHSVEGGPTYTFLEHGTTGDRYVWYLNDGERIGGALLATVGTDWTIAGSADFNSDEKPDIVWRNQRTGNTYLWYMDGGTRTGGTSLGSVGLDWSGPYVGDLNGDAQEDLLWSNRATGDLYVWLMDGASRQSAYSLGRVPTVWDVAAVGDLSGDFENDIVWEKVSTGERVIWVMDGLTRTDVLPIAVVEPKWTIVGVEDVGGTAHPDIVWENQTTGVRSVWLMDGPTSTKGYPLGTIETDWTIGAVAGPGSAFVIPEVTTGSVTNIGSDTATVAGTLDPKGEAVEWWFALSEDSQEFVDVTKPQMVAAGSSSTVDLLKKLTRLGPERDYYVRLEAKDVDVPYAGAQEGAAALFTTAPGPPVAPGELTGLLIKETDVTLAWSDQSATETGFKIERMEESDGSWSQVGSVGADVTTYVDTSGYGDVAYWYRVRATNAYGDSNPSNGTRVTTVRNWGTAKSLVMVRGDGQIAPVRDTIPNPLVVQVQDSIGQGVPNVALQVSVSSGGSVPCCEFTTDQEGKLSLSPWILGADAGSLTDSVTIRNDSLAGSPVRFTADATAGIPYRIISSGTTEFTAPLGTILQTPLTSVALDKWDNPIPGVRIDARDMETSDDGVNWQNEDETDYFFADPDGNIPQEIFTTDENGQVQMYWKIHESHVHNRFAPGYQDLHWECEKNGSWQDEQERCEPYLFTATGDVSSTPRLVIVQGNNQVADPGETLPVDPTIQALDGNSDPVGNVELVFTTNGGLLGNGSSTQKRWTDSHGYASVTWTLSTETKTNYLAVTDANFDYLDATFTATNSPTDGGGGDGGGDSEPGLPTPHSIVIISGDNQTGGLGETLPNPLVVEVRDSVGDPISGTGLSFSPSAGSVSTLDTWTDTNGRASVSYTLPTYETAATIEAATINGLLAQFSATAMQTTNLRPELKDFYGDVWSISSEDDRGNDYFMFYPASLSSNDSLCKLFGLSWYCVPFATLHDYERQREAYVRALRELAMQPRITDAWQTVLNEHLEKGSATFEQIEKINSILETSVAAWETSGKTVAEGVKVTESTQETLAEAAQTAGSSGTLTALHNAGGVLAGVTLVAEVTETMVGAALINALATDMARMRLDSIEASLERNRGSLDPALVEALAIAKSQLETIQNGGGALIHAVNENAWGLAESGLTLGKWFYHEKIASAVSAKIGISTAAVGVWGLGAFAVYKTILAVLENWQTGQDATALVTLSRFLTEEADEGQGGFETYRSAAYGWYSFYNAMVELLLDFRLDWWLSDDREFMVDYYNDRALEAFGTIPGY